MKNILYNSIVIHVHIQKVHVLLKRETKTILMLLFLLLGGGGVCIFQLLLN